MWLLILSRTRSHEFGEQISPFLCKSKFPPAIILLVIKSKTPLLMLDDLQLTRPTPSSSLFGQHLGQSSIRKLIRKPEHPFWWCQKEVQTTQTPAGVPKPFPQPYSQPQYKPKSLAPLCSCHLDWLVPALLSSGNPMNNVFLVCIASSYQHLNYSRIVGGLGRAHPALLRVTIKHSFCLKNFL